MEVSHQPLKVSQLTRAARTLTFNRAAFRSALRLHILVRFCKLRVQEVQEVQESVTRKQLASAYRSLQCLRTRESVVRLQICPRRRVVLIHYGPSAVAGSRS